MDEVEINTVPSNGNQVHNCKKRDCYFCYEMNRINHPFLNNNKKAWSEREIKFLIDNYQTMMAKDIEQIINRSQTAIWYKASLLGLKKANNPIKLNQYKTAV